MSTTYGKNLKLSIFGGSHDEKIYMTLDGIPAGHKIDMDELSRLMARRAPGQNKYSTQRKEPDTPVFSSGLDENNITTGDVIECAIYNTNQHSKDYSSLVDIPRPSHADYAARVKYGDGVDLRGGGHFREDSPPLCALRVASACRSSKSKISRSLLTSILSTT